MNRLFKSILSTLLFSIFTVFTIFANDTFLFYLASGQLVPSEEGEVNVEMSSEIINIVLEEDYYQVTVDFSFFNPSEDITLEVGFPFFEVGLYGSGNIYDFKCWTDGIEIDFSDKPIEKKWAKSTGLEKAYTRIITFPKNETVKTTITYKSKYGIYGSFPNLANYLYGTGSSWKNYIGKITLRIQNNALFYYPEEIFMAGKSIYSDFEKIDDKTFEAIFNNVEPETYTDTFLIGLNNIFGYTGGGKAFSKKSFAPCNEILTEKDIFWYTKPQLRYLRNTIYALHGYIFKSQDLKELFEYDGRFWAQPYSPNPNFSETQLSEIEKYNVKFILSHEK